MSTDITKLQATRDGFGQAMVELGNENPQVVVLCADLRDSLRLTDFSRNFPDRYFECGVAEQNMMSVGAGLALGGKIPFIASFAVFNPGRNLDQLRVAAYSQLNIKVVGGYAGFGNGGDGATHQAFEDLAIMSALPGMTVLAPADAEQAKILTKLAAKHIGPTYLRLGRLDLPTLSDTTEKEQSIKIGKAQLLREGSDLSIFTTGAMAFAALSASTKLNQLGLSVEVINFHTLKPFDHQAAIKSAQKTQAVLVVAEHDQRSGLASIVSQTLAEGIGDTLVSPIVFISLGINNRFGESGKNQDLLNKFELNEFGIIKQIKLLLAKKKNIV